MGVGVYTKRENDVKAWLPKIPMKSKLSQRTSTSAFAIEAEFPLVEKDGAVENLTVSMAKGRNRRAINEEKSPPAIDYFGLVRSFTDGHAKTNGNSVEKNCELSSAGRMLVQRRPIPL